MSCALVGSTRRAVGLVALLRRALVHCRGDVALGLLTPFGRRFLHAALQADRCALSRDPSHRYEVRTLSHAAKTQTRSRKIAFPARYFCGRRTRPAAFREPSDARRTASGKKIKGNRPWAKSRRTATEESRKRLDVTREAGLVGGKYENAYLDIIILTNSS